jgi:UDP-GlcNAc3NAcA epimerase
MAGSVKVVSVVGNRPQFVKSAPLSLALRTRGIDEVVLHTGQHYDRELSQVFFEELGLGEPAYRLDLQTADPHAMRPGIASALELERPDWAIVFGDTNSTLAGAQAAVAANVPIAHVEAGLRSGDLSMPEEHNRIEVDRLATLLFCPDERARETLGREGVGGHVEVVGDVMADALRLFGPVVRCRSRILARLGVEPGRYLVCTVHRKANVRPDRLARIVDGLNRIPEPIVFPAHPRTRARLHGLADHVTVCAPIGYLDFGALVMHSRALLTDSGGLQKEAYWWGVPCVTLRPSTEWTATVDVGANVLVDDDPGRIAAAAAAARMPAVRPTLYGDARAAERMVESLASLTRR